MSPHGTRFSSHDPRSGSRTASLLRSESPKRSNESLDSGSEEGEIEDELSKATKRGDDTWFLTPIEKGDVLDGRVQGFWERLDGTGFKIEKKSAHGRFSSISPSDQDHPLIVLSDPQSGRARVALCTSLGESELEERVKDREFFRFFVAVRGARYRKREQHWLIMNYVKGSEELDKKTYVMATGSFVVDIARVRKYGKVRSCKGLA